MTSEQFSSDCVYNTNGNEKKINYNSYKCEVTITVTCGNLNELSKVVSNNENNTILKCILDKIDPYLYNTKYSIEVFKIHKKYVLLKQSHLYYDVTLRKSFKINAFRYVRLV